MNQIFKVKKNSAGESVVTSELSKSHSTIAVAKMLLLGLYSGAAFAVPVSMQGTATSENAVAIGANSYSTAVSGVASGNGAIATGRNFSKADFETKQNENAQAIANVTDAETKVAHTRNLISSSNNSIGGINREIAELTKAQQHIQSKLEQKRNLEGQANNLAGTLGSQKTVLEQAQNALDAIKRDGKNKYLNFTDILSTLNWAGELNGGDAGRDRLAQSLKNIIDRDFPDFSSRYTTQQYRGIIDGYFNRIATYQGSLEGLSKPEYLGSSFYSDKSFGEWSFLANEKLEGRFQSTVTGAWEGYKSLLNEHYFKTSLDTLETDYVKMDNVFKYAFKDSYDYSDTYGFNGSMGVSKDGSLIYTRTGARDHRPRLSNIPLSEAALNTYLLANLSRYYSSLNNKFTALMPNTVHIVLMNKEINLSYGNDNFGETYNNWIKTNFSGNNIQFGVKLKNSNKLPNTNLNVLGTPYFFDDNIGVISKLQDYTPNSSNLISSEDISFFRQFYTTIKNKYNNIDWDHDASAYDLQGYKASFDKVLAYNAKIDNLLNIYEEILNERKLPNADTAKLEQLSIQVLQLREEVLAGVQDKTNFGMGMELRLNQANAEAYLHYADDQLKTTLTRIHNEIRLYNPNDQIVKDVSNQAKALEEAYNNAKKAVETTEGEIASLNEQIKNLDLTSEELAVDETKRTKEEELRLAETRKSELENLLTTQLPALEAAKQRLAETSLKDLGLRSQSYGSDAFASGNDAIAFGTNATAQGNDAIALGRDNKANAPQSLAIGSNNTVTGEKSIAIGTGHTVSGDRSTTIGDPNVISGNDSFAGGNNNSIASNNVIVLGNNITVEAGFDGSVVLGDGSTIARANPTASVTIRSNTLQFAGSEPTSVLSVGSLGAERQIINVAAGRIEATSTDAINGSQLYALVDVINNLKVTASTGSSTTVLGEGNIAVDNSVSNTATVKLSDDVNLGQNGSLTIGGVVIKGDSINAGNNVINGVAAGSVTANSKDAVNGAQLYATNQNITTLTNTVNKGLNFADDNGKVVNRQLGETQAIKGSNNVMTTFDADGALNVKLKDDVSVNSVTANTTKVGNVTINQNGIDAGGTKITNVMAGNITTDSQDAINGSQLYDVASNLQNQLNSVRVNTDWQKPVVQLNQRVDHLEYKVNKLNKHRKAGAASALAAAGLPQPMREGQSGIVAAAGQYGSQTGLAVGYTRANDSGKLIIRAAVTTNSQKEFGGNVGVGFFW